MKFIYVASLIIGMLFMNHVAYSQLPQNRYLIFSFEDTYKISPHGTQTYYWIQPIDSVKKGNRILKKIFVSGYSTSELQDCCLGKAINPYAGVIGSGSYSFSKEHYLMLDTLERMIKRHRKKIQSIKIVQKQGQQETANLFATPITGLFCMSDFLNIGLHGQNYNGKIYVPYGHFSFINNFWISQEGNAVLITDFSKFPFSILPASH
jgi:hypothetical protein